MNLTTTRTYCKNCGIALDAGGGCGVCKPGKLKATNAGSTTGTVEAVSKPAPKFTPGPWAWVAGALLPLSPSEQRHVSILIDSDGQCRVYRDAPIAEMEAEIAANKAMFAAGPELLAALLILRAAHSIIEPHHEDICAICKQADAAIKKATA